MYLERDVILLFDMLLEELGTLGSTERVAGAECERPFLRRGGNQGSEVRRLLPPAAKGEIPPRYRADGSPT